MNFNNSVNIVWSMFCLHSWKVVGVCISNEYVHKPSTSPNTPQVIPSSYLRHTFTIAAARHLLCNFRRHCPQQTLANGSSTGLKSLLSRSVYSQVSSFPSWYRTHRKLAQIQPIVTKVYSRATDYLHFHSNKSIPSSKASLGLSSAIRPAPLCFLNSKANKSKRLLASLAWGYLVLSAQPQFASWTIGW